MVIATSGKGSTINYNRIISSARPPSYSVFDSDTKTFRDAALTTTKRLRGFFIIDRDNLVSLVYDATTFKTDVATVSLSTVTVTYKASIHNILNMQTSMFISASVYFSPSS
jgi:hypothetical protein